MLSLKAQGLATNTLVRGHQEGQKVKASSPSMSRRALLAPPRRRRSTPSVAAAAALPASPREAPLPGVRRCSSSSSSSSKNSPSQPSNRLCGPITAAAAAPADAPPPPAVDHVQAALADLEDESLVVFAATAPAVRVAIGEALAQATGVQPAPSPSAVQPGQLVSALRLLGFDRVFDVATGADLTIMEEGYELLARLAERAEAAASVGVDEEGEGKEGRRSGSRSEGGGTEPGSSFPPHHHHHGPLPMFTSCCPGWVSLVEAAAPELLPHVSSCKSPHLMLGAVLKKYFAPRVMGVDPRRVRVVSVMPCIKKQGEADRPGNEWGGMRDVDHVITTKELAEVLKERGVTDLAALPVSAYDDPLAPPPPRDGKQDSASSHSPPPSSAQSGSGVLFGTTGGVMEAALRTVYEAVTGERLARLEFYECRVRKRVVFFCGFFFFGFFCFFFVYVSTDTQKKIIQGLEGVREATVHMKVPKGSPLLGGGGGGIGGAAAAGDSSESSSPSPASLRSFSDPAPTTTTTSTKPYPPAPHASAVPLTGMDDTLHLRVAVCNGLANAKKLLAAVKDGTAPPYDFVECMACPAGCIGGGGQPRPADKSAIAAWQAALYSLDERAVVRRSHENPAVRFLYEKFLGEPLSAEAEASLHTTYGKQKEEKKEKEEKEKGEGGQTPDDHHECHFCGAMVEKGGGGCAGAAG